MSNIIQYAYVSGEISQSLFFRSDLEKYDLGLALARDWFVDYRGGISTRPGSQYKEWQQFPDKTIRWFPFEFSPQVANTNIVIFGDGYIRFTQEGQYILEAGKTVTGVTTPGVATVVAHGWTTGDLGRFTVLVGANNFVNRLFEIEVLTVNTFRLKDQFGAYVAPTTAFTSGIFARVYTLDSPYAHADLGKLNVEQIRDTLRLTHYGYKTKDLKRIDSTNWTITDTVFSSQIARPTGLVGSPSSVGTAGVVYTVTAVDHNGSESLPADSLLDSATVNFTVTAGSYQLNWSPVAGARYYNVYRSTVASDGGRISRSMQLGFLGRASGTVFLDTNIIPSFTRMPPQQTNPFANGAISWIDVLTPGTGFTAASVVTVTDPDGSGFVGYPVVESGGTLAGIVVVNEGEGYTSPIVSVNVGTGATFAVELSSSSGNYPAVSSVFQQRQIYAGTISAPLGIWGSRPRRFNNFDTSPIVVDNDSYEFEIDAAKVSLIRHLFPMRGGLLVMNDIGIWQLSGGNQIAVTATNALAEPQSYTGISNLTPLKLETDLVYVESKGYTIRLLAYNDLAKVYAGTDISILSSHFFGKGREIVSWTYAQEPYKLIHAVREDGYRLLGSLVKDQNVYAWTLASTQGFYKQVLTIREDRLDRVYLDVARYINGKLVRYIELEAEREFEKIEDAWCVDSGLSLPVNYPAHSLTVFSSEGSSVLFRASGAAFSPADVGAVIFVGGGKAQVISYVSAIEVNCKIIRPITAFIPQTETPRIFTSGEWSLDQPVTVISGLHHLEGQTVSILADGNVFPQQVVMNGSITLTSGVTRAVVGLAYKAQARTLPPTASGVILASKRKRMVGVTTRVNNSRGLLTGTSLTSLYEVKERSTEQYGEPVLPRSDMRFQSIEPQWNIDGQLYYVVEDPLPVTLLGHVLEMEAGDD